MTTKHKIRFLACLAAAILVGVAVAQAESFDDLLAQADRLYSVGDYDAALVKYRAAASAGTPAQKNTAEIRMSQVHLAKGKPASARSLLDGVLRRTPEDADALVAEAKIYLYYEADEPAALTKCERLLVKAIKAEPRNPSAWTQLGYVSLARGQLQDAIEKFRKVIDTMDKKHFPAYYGAARAYVQFPENQAREYYRARAMMQACLDEGPDVAESHWMAGNIELAIQDAGCEERALSSYLYAMGLDDANPKYKGYAIVAHMLAHRYGAAQPIEVALRAQAPESSYLYVAEGIRYELKADVVPAAEDYQRAVDMDWNNPWAHWCLAQILLGRGNREFVDASLIKPYFYGPFQNPSKAEEHLLAIQRIAPEFPFRAEIPAMLKRSTQDYESKNDPVFRQKIEKLKRHRSRIRSAAPNPGL